MLPRWCKQTVTVERAPMTKERGAAFRDWKSKNVARHEIGGCLVRPLEPQDGHEANGRAVIACKLLMPLDADIQRGDRVVVEGVRYLLDGTPTASLSPFGGADHKVAYLREWVA